VARFPSVNLTYTYSPARGSTEHRPPQVLLSKPRAPAAVYRAARAERLRRRARVQARAVFSQLFRPRVALSSQTSRPQAAVGGYPHPASGKAESGFELWRNHESSQAVCLRVLRLIARYLAGLHSGCQEPGRRDRGACQLR
jgi:hypothetical protein